LVLIDDLIIDVSRFMSEHPGGKFLLEHNVGRDISKYFYGAFILENGVGLSPHRHSNVARTIVNKLIVGRLNQERVATFTVRTSATQVINHFSKCFIMRVEGPDPGWRQPASTDIKSFGKHYLLRSYHRPNVKRHYTIAACMKKDAYDQYLGLIQQFKDG
jgi:hypothetical protein